MHDGRSSEWHGEEVALGFLGSLLDGQRNFLCLAIAETDLTLAVTDHHESGEAETTTTLDDLGDAVDVDHAGVAETTLVLAIVVASAAIIAVVAIVVFVRHQNSSPASRAASAKAATRPW